MYVCVCVYYTKYIRQIDKYEIYLQKKRTMKPFLKM